MTKQVHRIKNVLYSTVVFIAQIQDELQKIAKPTLLYNIKDNFTRVHYWDFFLVVNRASLSDIILALKYKI